MLESRFFLCEREQPPERAKGEYMANLAIIGYGRMGRIIERYARERGHEITSIIDPNCPDCHTTISDDTLGESEICIDFSHPDSVMENMRHVLELGRNMVVGTTGWFGNTKWFGPFQRLC